MLMHPKIDPVALQLGPIAIHWYGLTYLVAFGLFMLLAMRRLHHEPFASVRGPGAWSRKDEEDILHQILSLLQTYFVYHILQPIHLKQPISLLIFLQKQLFQMR